MILVSNRLSAFRFADQIFVLDNGEIVDFGGHDELIHREGLYKIQTWDIQSDENTTTS